MTKSTKLDLTPLEKAIKRLYKSLEYYHSEMAKKDHELLLQFMAATIQSFEFTYELCSKFIQRYLKLVEPSVVIIDEMSFPDIIRTASARGLLLNEWGEWKQYRDKRNITSHTYDELKAHEVMKIVPQFLEEAQYLLAKLKDRMKTS